MAQYKTGTVSVTNGSATVTGSGTAFLANAVVGGLFQINGEGIAYQISAIGSDTSLTLSAPYAGTTGSGKSYSISKDFTSRHSLPTPNRGDVDVAVLLTRALAAIDSALPKTWIQSTNPGSSNGLPTYKRGDSWINTTTTHEWVCVVDTAGAATWRQRTA